MTNFILTRILCLKSGRQRKSPPIVIINEGFFFFPWQIGTLSLFLGAALFSFLSRTFFCFWFFHKQRFFQKQRASTSEFCQVGNVNKICLYMKNESQDERSIRRHFRYTGYRPLNVAWSTAVFSNFRSPFRGIWSLSSSSCYSRSDNMAIGGAGSFLVVILPVEYYFIPKKKENVAWPIKAYQFDERKQLLTQKLSKVAPFFLLICFITTPFPKGVFCCCLDIGTHQSTCIDFTWGHYGHTVCGLLVLAFDTAVCSTFRAFFDSIWSLSTRSHNSRSDKMVLCRASSFLVWV